MAGKLSDRISTIVVTATLTSAVWIVAGGTLMELSDSDSQRETTRPADAAPSPQPTPVQDVAPTPTGTAPGSESGGERRVVTDLDRAGASLPDERQAREMMIPVLNIRPSDLTDTFIDARGGVTRLHEAIDIMAPEGTTVVAAAPGTIEKLYTSKASGKAIYVRSSDRETIHYYSHLGAYAEGLTEGQRVRRGQRLGEVGSTGNAREAAPHLHFAILRTTADAEWWEPANAINPYPLLTRK